MLSSRSVRELLQPFAVDLADDQVEQVLVYLDLLLRWNRKINLTAIRTPEECITRHFGESFLLSRIDPLTGSLLDVGSGAGFPGLALKILCPEIPMLLLEPVGKKRAFLKEVINVCQLSSVEVAGSTIEQLSREEPRDFFDVVTIRAVGNLGRLVPHALECLKASGHLCLWIGSDQAEAILRSEAPVEWKDPVPIPLARRRQILVGSKLYIS
jgi:16S rRNA (guanine527-N7)-methyltransferase